MRRFLIVSLCLATLLWGIVGANAAITYTTVGSSTSTGTSLAINPSANIPAGSLIVVGIFNRGASSGSISDTKGNSYVLGANGANGPSPSGYGAVYYVYNSVALTTSDTITFTSPNSGISMTLGYATGIMTASDPKDFSPTVTSSSAGTSQSVTGSAATVAGELNVCIAGGFNGAGARTLSRPGSPWSVGNDIVNYSVSSAFYTQGGAYQINSGTGALTCTFTASNSENWVAMLLGFKPPAPSSSITLFPPIPFP